MLNDLIITELNFNKPEHCRALKVLMNEYITDKMGGGMAYTVEQEELLVHGLNSHPACICLVAVLNKEIVGLLNSFVNFSTFTVKPYINIHDVIVKNKYRNLGIGRQMIEFLTVKAKQLGCSRLTLEVREDNHPARHLYKSMGFNDTTPAQAYWIKQL